MEDLKKSKQPAESDSPPVLVTGPGTSRAININAPVQAVTAMCAEHEISISTIEPLDSGGTRVVLNTAGDAEHLRRRMKAQLIQGTVVRSSLHLARRPHSFL